LTSYYYYCSFAAEHAAGGAREPQHHPLVVRYIRYIPSLHLPLSLVGGVNVYVTYVTKTLLFIAAGLAALDGVNPTLHALHSFLTTTTTTTTTAHSLRGLQRSTVWGCTPS